jgi:transposase
MARPRIEAHEIGMAGLAKAMKMRYATYKSIIDEYEKTGQIPEPKRIGRPMKIGDKKVVDVVELDISRLPQMTTADLKKGIKEQCKVTLSETSLRRILNNLRFHFKPPKKMPRLSPTQVMIRYQFAHDLMHPLPGFVKLLDQYRIVSSDESRFGMRSDGHWVWRRNGETAKAISQETEKFEIGVMVWGARP